MYIFFEYKCFLISFCYGLGGGVYSALLPNNRFAHANLSGYECYVVGRNMEFNSCLVFGSY